METSELLNEKIKQCSEELQELWKSSNVYFENCKCGKQIKHISFLMLPVPFIKKQSLGGVRKSVIEKYTTKYELSEEQVKEIIIKIVKNYFDILSIIISSNTPMFTCNCKVESVENVACLV